MLVRLMYASRAAAGVGCPELQAILRTSQAHNPTAGVTGVLCFSQGVFLQVLEGGRTAVNRLYHRIVNDPRHAQVELISYEDIAERRFAAWSMGHVDMARLNPSQVLRYCEQATLDPFAVPSQALMALFDELMAAACIVGQR